MRTLRPTRSAAAAVAKRRGVLELRPLTVAVDAGLGARKTTPVVATCSPNAQDCFVAGGRLGQLFPAADTVAESEAGGGGGSADAGAGPAAMELSVECADVTARLHCLLPGTLTPVAEYLELRAAVEGGDGGWRLKYRSWDGGKPHESDH